MSSDTPELDGLNLIAKDMSATLGFYRLLGVEIPEEAVWGSNGGDHVQANTNGSVDFDLDSERLAQAYNAGWDQTRAGGRTLIGFKVDSRQAVDRIYATLTDAGYPSLQEPYDAFWGARCAIVEDPDGRSVGIMSRPDDAHRSPPPQL